MIRDSGVVRRSHQALDRNQAQQVPSVDHRDVMDAVEEDIAPDRGADLPGRGIGRGLRHSGGHSFGNRHAPKLRREWAPGVRSSPQARFGRSPMCSRRTTHTVGA